MIRFGLLSLLIVFLPNALHFPFETGLPGLNLSNVLFVLAVVAVFLSAPEPLPVSRRQTRLRPALRLWFLALGAGFVLAQMHGAADMMADVTYLKNAIFYPLLYLLFRHCRLDAAATRRLIILVLIVAAVAGLEAVREGLDYGLTSYAPTRRASGPFGVDYRNANRAGVFYAMFMPMFVALALFLRKQRIWRLAALAGCAILTVAILATFSRQAYAIAIVAVGALLLRRNLLVGALMLVLLAAAIPLLPQGVTERVQETEQVSTSGAEELDTSTASRFEIWSGALWMWSENPLGVGLNRFKRHIGDYSHYAGYDAHNFYILTLAELGPVGLAALAFLLLNMLRLARFVRASAHSADEPEALALARGFTMLVIAMALGNVYGSPFLEGSVMSTVWILCGLIERHSQQLQGAVGMCEASEAQVAHAPTVFDRFPLAARAFPGHGRVTRALSPPSSRSTGERSS